MSGILIKIFFGLIGFGGRQFQCYGKNISFVTGIITQRTGEKSKLSQRMIRFLTYFSSHCPNESKSDEGPSKSKKLSGEWTESIFAD